MDQALRAAHPANVVGFRVVKGGDGRSRSEPGDDDLGLLEDLLATSVARALRLALSRACILRCPSSLATRLLRVTSGSPAPARCDGKTARHQHGVQRDVVVIIIHPPVRCFAWETPRC